MFRLLRKSLLIILTIGIILFLIVNRLPWLIDYWQQDYPGPQTLANDSAKKSNEIDWLLIHGASTDARVWQKILAQENSQPLVALSVGNHQLGTPLAEPGDLAAQQLIKYLQTHKINQGIIGYSTAALWIADAYQQCPICFNHLKIILMAPNIGNNAIDLTADNRNFLQWAAMILPDPYIEWRDVMGSKIITACLGDDEAQYDSCRNDYLYGRWLMVSLSYYEKLIAYMDKGVQQQWLDKFFTRKRPAINIYLAGNDKVLTNLPIQELAKKRLIPIMIIPNTSHQGLLAKVPQLIK